MTRPRPHPLTPFAETAFSEAHKSANIICRHVCRTLQNGNLIALKLFDIVRRRTALAWPRHSSLPPRILGLLCPSETKQQWL